MKTKEINVWVSPSDLGNKYFSVVQESADCPMKGDSVKAKLIIELPERKVTITESEFEEAVKFANKDYHNQTVGDDRWIESMRFKLFNQGGEGV